MKAKQNIHSGGCSIFYATTTTVSFTLQKSIVRIKRLQKIEKILKVIDPMDKIFVTYEIAEQLSLKGFRDPCFGYYNDYKIINSHSSSPLHRY
jgi:hypothetical protein